MFLHSLLRQFDPSLRIDSIPNLDITGVCEDSRLARPGELFVARPGTKTDGRQYIADAAVHGAAAVLTDRPLADCPLQQIIVGSLDGATSRLAHLWHGRPSEQVNLLGVTGTNGKTSVCYLIRHILAASGRRCGMVGTVEVDDGRQRATAEMTTPPAAQLASLLARMRDGGCEACALEVSSHALAQGRVAGVRFAGAGFTNLTGDHLDFHKTKRRYAAAKAGLFEMLEAGAVAVVNAQDPWSARMVRRCAGRVVRFGLGRKGEWRARKIQITPDQSSFILDARGETATTRIALVGRHNIANALAAAALVGEVYHLSVQQIADALATAPRAPGRLQAVTCGQPFAVYVDYAHTDDGLENVLRALRPLARGKLRVLFGCGGDRDRSKRPRMAAVAERYADEMYITSDNPRTENANAIVDEIISGLSADVELSGASRNDSTQSKGISDGVCGMAIVEVDRRRAIERILADAQAGDVVLLAGKGHETYQIIGHEKRHFDDVEEAQRVLQGMATTRMAG